MTMTNGHLKLLVVDNFSMMRKLVKHFLGDMGITDVDEADNTFSALKLLRTSKYDALIVDWSVTGYEVMRSVRANASLRDTQVLVITDDISNETLMMAAEFGAREILHKPFLHTSLPLKIAELFPAARAQEHG